MRTYSKVAALVLLLLPGWAAADDKAVLKQVEEELAKLDGGGARIAAVKDDALPWALPGHAFVSVVFPQFPVGRVPPKPLKTQDVYACKGGKLQLLTDATELEKFFKAAQAPVKAEKAAKDAAQAWLRLTQVFSDDGFFKFSIPADSLKAEPDGKGWKVSGQAVVDKKGGDMGEISVTLTFDAQGTLAQVEEKRNVKAGIRPRCQATKLLDRDPIVREMAEQSILVMGSAAKSYLEEQRAKASPELRKAIDRMWKRIVDEGR